MVNCELKAHTVSDISFINRLDPNVQIKMGNKFSYSLKYPSDKTQNVCRGELSVEVGDTSDDSKLSVKATIVGIFTYNPDASKEVIHAESFKMIYPYARALVTTITANAGIRPIIMPYLDIDNENIIRFDGKPE